MVKKTTMESTAAEDYSNDSGGQNDNKNNIKCVMNDTVLPVVTANSIVELLNSPIPKTYSSTTSIAMDTSPSTSGSLMTNVGGVGNSSRNSINNQNSNGPKMLDESKMAVKFEQKLIADGPKPEPFICAGCNCKIVDRYLLKALDKLWHEDCLKCDACSCRLAEVGKSFFIKCGKIYCRRDYARLFLAKGKCSACNDIIPACELVMRASANVYHLECFGCQECNQRFCVGDRFYLDVDNNKILCEYDYNERIYFAQLAQSNFGYNSLAQLKRQISQVDDYDEVQPVPR